MGKNVHTPEVEKAVKGNPLPGKCGRMLRLF